MVAFPVVAESVDSAVVVVVVLYHAEFSERRDAPIGRNQ